MIAHYSIAIKYMKKLVDCKLSNRHTFCFAKVLSIMLEKRELRFPLLSPTKPVQGLTFFAKKVIKKATKKSRVCYSQIGFFRKILNITECIKKLN